MRSRTSNDIERDPRAATRLIEKAVARGNIGPRISVVAKPRFHRVDRGLQSRAVEHHSAMQSECARVGDPRGGTVETGDAKGVDEHRLPFIDEKRHLHAAVAVLRWCDQRVDLRREIPVPAVEHAQPSNIEAERVAVETALRAEDAKIPSRELAGRRCDTEREVAGAKHRVATKLERANLRLARLTFGVLGAQRGGDGDNEGGGQRDASRRASSPEPHPVLRPDA